MDPRLLLLAATLWQPAAGVDQYGDPLPKGALLRGAPQRPSLTSTPRVARLLRPGESGIGQVF